jgi:hypothetical protein
MATMRDNDQNNISVQLDYLTAILLDFFRAPQNEHRFLEAAKISLNHISRLVKGETLSLEKRFIYFASKLKNNVSPLSIRNFAKECLRNVDMGLEKNVTVLGAKALQKQAQRDLSLSIASGYSEACAIQRAAHELLKIKRRFDAKERLIMMAKAHPLRDVLSWVELNDAPLPKEDVRNHFLHLKKSTKKEKHGDGMLWGLLEKAQAFSVRRLHGLLGDELFFLCRPLGFFNQNRTALLIEVPTNAHLHALTYRKLEILRALKKDAAFYTVKDLRFKVGGTVF